MQMLDEYSIVRWARRAAAAAAFAAALVSQPSIVRATGSPPMLANGELSVILSRGLVTYPLRKGVWQTKIAPALLTDKDSRNGQEVDLSGAGIGASLTYGLSDHWGINFIVGYSKTDGTRHMSTCYTQGNVSSCSDDFVTAKVNNNLNGQPGEAKGFAFLANIIWDHWSGDGFRLPVYFGTGFMEAKGSVETASGVRREGKTSAPVLTVGLNPSWGIKKKFRLGGFFLISGPLSGGKGSIVDFNPATGAENSRVDFDISGDPMESGTATIGLEATYLPWGLSFGYIPAIEGRTSISFKWSREWGGDKD